MTRWSSATARCGRACTRPAATRALPWSPGEDHGIVVFSVRFADSRFITAAARPARPATPACESRCYAASSMAPGCGSSTGPRCPSHNPSRPAPRNNRARAGVRPLTAASPAGRRQPCRGAARAAGGRQSWPFRGRRPLPAGFGSGSGSGGTAAGRGVGADTRDVPVFEQQERRGIGPARPLLPEPAIAPEPVVLDCRGWLPAKGERRFAAHARPEALRRVGS